MVSEKAFWMGRDVTHASELTQELRDNAAALLIKVNAFLADLGRGDIEEGVNSGWRPASINAATPGAAQHSSHMICKAVDIHDPNREIDDLVDAHPELLVKHCLNHEATESTPGWCHLDDRVGLGFRTFKV